MISRKTPFKGSPRRSPGPKGSPRRSPRRSPGPKGSPRRSPRRSPGPKGSPRKSPGPKGSPRKSPGPKKVETLTICQPYPTTRESPRKKKISEVNSYEYHCGDSFEQIYNRSINQRKSDEEILELVTVEKNSNDVCKFMVEGKDGKKEIKPKSGRANLFSTRSCIGYHNHDIISQKNNCSKISNDSSDDIKNYLSSLTPYGPKCTKEHIYSFFEKLAKYTILTPESLKDILKGAFTIIRKDGGLFYDIITEDGTSPHIYMVCERFKGSSHESRGPQCRTGSGSLNCMDSTKISSKFDLLFGKTVDKGDTWFQFEGARGTLRKDGTVNMGNVAHTMTTIDYAARRAANYVAHKASLGFAGEQLFPANVGPCGHSKFNDGNPMYLKLKKSINSGSGNRRGRSKQLIEIKT